MKDYLKDKQAVLKEQGVDGEQGLTTAEAARRLETNGKNKLVEAKKTSLLKRFMEQLADPMIIILIVAAVISGITALYAHESFADVIIIMIVVIINAVLGVV
ncbi:MAG: cation-transporting P-type ATPase, partial [Hungatella sp.]